MPSRVKQVCPHCLYDSPKVNPICPACGLPLPVPMRVVALASVTAVLSLAVVIFFTH